MKCAIINSTKFFFIVGYALCAKKRLKRMLELGKPQKTATIERRTLRGEYKLDVYTNICKMTYVFARINNLNWVMFFTRCVHQRRENNKNGILLYKIHIVAERAQKISRSRICLLFTCLTL